MSFGYVNISNVFNYIYIKKIILILYDYVTNGQDNEVYNDNFLAHKIHSYKYIFPGYKLNYPLLQDYEIYYFHSHTYLSVVMLIL